MDNSDEPPKKRSRTVLKCPTCLEEVSVLEHVGCSNNHYICPPCSRKIMSDQIVWQTFPNKFPGDISTFKTNKCPLCRERVQWGTNIYKFVDTRTDCPFSGYLKKECKVEGSLKQHLLKHHHSTVPCPHCLIWIDSSDKNSNVGNTLTLHMFRCKKLMCKGCGFRAPYMSLYLHSSEKDKAKHHCEEPCFMFNGLIELMGKLHHHEVEGVHDMSHFAFIAVQTCVQYVLQLLRKSAWNTNVNEWTIQLLLPIFNQICRKFTKNDLEDFISPIVTSKNPDANVRQTFRKIVSECCRYPPTKYVKLPFLFRMLMIVLQDSEILQASITAHKKADNDPLKKMIVTRLCDTVYQENTFSLFTQMMQSEGVTMVVQQH